MDREWTKSSTSNSQGNCIEIAEGDNPGELLIRESDSPIVHVRTTRENFRAFVEGARLGDFDRFVTE